MNGINKYTDTELAEMAQWAEDRMKEAELEKGNLALNRQKKMAYGTIKQGIDWLLRARILERSQDGVGQQTVERKQ